MLWLDLAVFQKKDHVIGIKESLWWSVFWTVLALIFNLGLYFFMGREKALTFFTGYLIERSLSMDNLFVFLVIFNYFKVDGKYQHKILFWGILGALVMRAVFIFAGIALIKMFSWTIYVFGAFLIYTGYKLVFQEDKEVDPEHNVVLKAIKKIFPLTTAHDGNFFARIDNRLFMTPLFVVLILVETSDVMFAVDSIPAILSITTDPFIVYTSNVFAILGLRALYFALAALMDMFEYLDYGLGIILAFVGVKMLIQEHYHIPIGVALGVICLILTASILISIWKRKRPQCNKVK